MPFDEIVASLIRMAEDSVVTTRQVSFTVIGELGTVPADIATPLAVVLAELLQNAIEHAFIEFTADDEDEASLEGAGRAAVASVGHIAVRLCHNEESLTVEVADDGAGLPVGFDIDATSSLGLSIVRDLVRSQLGGTI